MKKIFTFVATLFLTVALFSCQDDLNEDFLWYQKAETGCADPWNTFGGQSDSDLKEEVKVFLNEMNIQYDKVEIGFDSTLVQLCLACTCTTGTFIKLHASSSHVEALNEIGFVLIASE